MVDATTVPLGPGEVPQALVDTARVLPWVTGGRWTYRRTGVYNAVHWSSDTVTESVVSAQRMSATTMRVKLRRENAKRTDIGADGTRTGIWADGTGSTHFMRPDGLFADFGLEQLEPGRPEAMFRLPLQPATEVGYFWYVDKIESVAVPAGRFDNCYVLVENAGAANLHAHWLCPGVGFVRHELPSCSGDDGANVLYELTDFYIPPIVPVP